MSKQSYQTLERKARKFATRAHNGQFRDGKAHLPYITHPAAVVRILKKAGITDQNVLAAAWLHDVMEDCEVTFTTLVEEFNLHVAQLVYAVTRPKGGDRLDTLIEIQQAEPEAQLIKVADVLHNSRTLEKDFIRLKWERKYYAIKWVYYDLAKKLCVDGYLKDLKWACWLDISIKYMEHYLKQLDKQELV